MPIYEYQCRKCLGYFERLELSIVDIPTSQCPMCAGVGIRLMSAPAIIYEAFDERAIHRLPDWNQKMTQAKVHDAKLPPLKRDLGQGIKQYNMEFGRMERDRLREKSQLDNMG